MDIKMTFLHGPLHEEIYMKQLEGFVYPSCEHQVLGFYKVHMASNKLLVHSMNALIHISFMLVFSAQLPITMLMFISMVLHLSSLRCMWIMQFWFVTLYFSYNTSRLSYNECLL
jgi:hypothetical protein